MVSNFQKEPMYSKANAKPLWLNWPTQQHPPHSSWKLWHTTLNYLEDGEVLKQPLGPGLMFPIRNENGFFTKTETF
jgi:hypothetical protein